MAIGDTDLVNRETLIYCLEAFEVKKFDILDYCYLPVIVDGTTLPATLKL